MYEVRLSSRANRYYQRLDTDTALRLNQCFEALSGNPFTANDVRPLRGRRGLYRARVGELRVIFTISQLERTVMVITIGPRGDVY